MGPAARGPARMKGRGAIRDPRPVIINPASISTKTYGAPALFFFFVTRSNVLCIALFQSINSVADFNQRDSFCGGSVELSVELEKRK